MGIFNEEPKYLAFCQIVSSGPGCHKSIFRFLRGRKILGLIRLKYFGSENEKPSPYLIILPTFNSPIPIVLSSEGCERNELLCVLVAIFCGDNKFLHSVQTLQRPTQRKGRHVEFLGL